VADATNKKERARELRRILRLGVVESGTRSGSPDFATNADNIPTCKRNDQCVRPGNGWRRGRSQDDGDGRGFNWRLSDSVLGESIMTKPRVTSHGPVCALDMLRGRVRQGFSRPISCIRYQQHFPLRMEDFPFNLIHEQAINASDVLGKQSNIGYGQCASTPTVLFSWVRASEIPLRKWSETAIDGGWDKLPSHTSNSFPGLLPSCELSDYELLIVTTLPPSPGPHLPLANSGDVRTARQARQQIRYITTLQKKTHSSLAATNVESSFPNMQYQLSKFGLAFTAPLLSVVTCLPVQPTRPVHFFPVTIRALHIPSSCTDRRFSSLAKRIKRRRKTNCCPWLPLNVNTPKR
jgi:hypothetical protein